VLLPSTAWYIPHLRVSCADRNSSKTGAMAHNSNRGNSSSNNNSTVLLCHQCSRMPSGHHSSFPPVTSPTTTVERWGTLLESAASPSKATHHELRHPWSISRGAIRRTCATDWSCQLYHRGEDSHGRRSASGYVLPQ
jgi:hypothetical protein